MEGKQFCKDVSFVWYTNNSYLCWYNPIMLIVVDYVCKKALPRMSILEKELIKLYPAGFVYTIRKNFSCTLLFL